MSEASDRICADFGAECGRRVCPELVEGDAPAHRLDLSLASTVFRGNLRTRCSMPPEFNQNTVMLAELNKRLNAVPFVAFAIVTSSGRSYEVPAPDHLTITRLLREVFVEKDDGTAVVINLLHIVAIERLEPTPKAG